MTVDFDGVVTWKPTTQMEAWCSLDLSNWPNDVQVCDVQIGLWSQEQLLELAILEPGVGTTVGIPYTVSHCALTDCKLT